jgi:multidrug efflux system outer membrane protein
MRLLPLITALVIAGCATVPEIDASRLPEAPATFKDADSKWTVAPPAASSPRGEWWKAFADPKLDELIEHADRGNNSIQVAAARLAQARAIARITDADRAPQLTAGASVARVDGFSNGTFGAPRNFGTVGANLGYEVDLFGKLAKASDAAALDAQSREALLQSTRLLVQAEVAQTYLSIRALDVERALVRRTVAAYRGTLDLTERRFRAGDVAELDVARARTEVAATESEALGLDRRRAQLENALAVLAGEVASSFALRRPSGTRRCPEFPRAFHRRCSRGVPTFRPHNCRCSPRSSASGWRRRRGSRISRSRRAVDTPRPSWAISSSGPLARGAWARSSLSPSSTADVAPQAWRTPQANSTKRSRTTGQVLVAFRDVEDELAQLRILADQARRRAGRSIRRARHRTFGRALSQRPREPL